MSKVYESVKVLKCSRCKQETRHSLFDYNSRLYKCNICGQVYIPKK